MKIIIKKIIKQINLDLQKKNEKINKIKKIMKIMKIKKVEVI